MSELVERSIWRAMKARCHNPKTKKYRIYGSRGIKVCDEWRNSFETFYRDMGPRPGPEYSVERKDNNGNYEPDNCKWATPIEQGNNRSDNIVITINERTQTLTQWCEEFGVPYGTIWYRIRIGGMEPLEALTKPIEIIATHCKYGHKFSGENLYIRPKTGQKICRICAKERILKFKQRKQLNGRI